MPLVAVAAYGFGLIAGLWTASCILGLVRNYIKARQLGLKIIVNPIHSLNPLWILLTPWIWPMIMRLPFGLDYYFNYTNIDWPYRDKYREHEKYGRAFVVVNPVWVMIYVADPAAIDDIFSRRKDFTKPEIFYKPMEFLGPNVDSVEGITWQRHRKITTPPFNERNSALVWKESLRQAGDMMTSWSHHNRKGITSTSADTLTLALHVLTGAGFGQSYSFASGSQIIPRGHLLSYRDSLCTLLTNFTPLIIFNHDLLCQPFMPKTLRKVGLAVREFRQYMTEMISRERLLIEKRDSDASNLVSSLIRASEEGKAFSSSLNDEEIMGNLFIYNLAGHETTANTLAYAIMLISVNPIYQDWLYDELTRVLGDAGQPETWKYEKVFPQLQRTLAVMYETLRIYGPVPSLSKIAVDAPQMLTVNSKDYSIPQGAFVVLNSIAIHTDPKYWGSKPLEWTPKRWIDTTETSGDRWRAPPTKGSYVPWADGPRVCPGKKFSQVEFTAVMATLFRNWTVSPKLEAGETMEEAQERVMGVVNDSAVTITLQMKRPTSVGLVWKRR